MPLVLAGSEHRQAGPWAVAGWSLGGQTEGPWAVAVAPLAQHHHQMHSLQIRARLLQPMHSLHFQCFHLQYQLFPTVQADLPQVSQLEVVVGSSRWP